MKSPDPGSDSLGILSRLLFSPRKSSEPGKANLNFRLSHRQFQGVLSLANSHHVVIRSMQALLGTIADNEKETCQWAATAIEQEGARINHAVAFLSEICRVLSSEGCEAVVIKSLDHWPDFGSDLDLYTDADPAAVVSAMEHRLDAQVAARSWGDRLANKWNFIVPGLPELVEIHVGRLGQTGELGNFAKNLVARARVVSVGSHQFHLLSAVDRLLVCTLQRMYRHFYIRLCDIADTAQLLEDETIDYEDLQDVAQRNGIWEGAAAFLRVVSDYVARWRGSGTSLPASVRSAAPFGGDQIAFANGFLRVPILPHSVRLYASEWTALALRGEVRSAARLSLLPGLATAAALGLKITGSDKGVW